MAFTVCPHCQRKCSMLELFDRKAVKCPSCSGKFRAAISAVGVLLDGANPLGVDQGRSSQPGSDAPPRWRVVKQQCRDSWRTGTSYREYRARVAVERLCSACGEHFEHCWIVETERVESDKADQMLTAVVEKFVKDREWNATNGVCCPKCHQFTSAAMARHFPSGYRSRLEDELRRSEKTLTRRANQSAITIPMLGFLVVPAAMGIVFWAAVGGEHNRTIVMAFGIPMALVTLISAAGCFRMWRNTLRWNRERFSSASSGHGVLNGLSEEELHELVLRLYREHGESFLAFAPCFDPESQQFFAHWQVLEFRVKMGTTAASAVPPPRGSLFADVHGDDSEW